MQIVIDISENTYRQIQALVRNEYFEHDICGNSMRRIANGTPLPKGHGRLIDADKFHEVIENIPIKDTDKWFNWMQKTCNRLADAPTIIEGSESE